MLLLSAPLFFIRSGVGAMVKVDPEGMGILVPEVAGLPRIHGTLLKIESLDLSKQLPPQLLLHKTVTIKEPHIQSDREHGMNSSGASII